MIKKKVKFDNNFALKMLAFRLTKVKGHANSFFKIGVGKEMEYV